MDIKKVLVIGGAGYIGAHVVESLHAHNYEIIVLDNLNTGKKEHLIPEAQFVKQDIRDIDGLDKTFAQIKPDAVIHLAALKAAGESMEKATDYSDVNIVGTINILKAMTSHKVKYIVFSSSAATYGEPQYLPMDEAHIQNPSNYYGATKLIMEQIIDWYSKAYDIHYTALRYFNAAGHTPSKRIKVVEKNPQNLIPVVLETAMGLRPLFQIFGDDYPTDDGTCLRDYIHVCDLAEGHVRSLKYLETHNKSATLNLGTGKAFSVMEIYKVACKITQKKIPMQISEKRAGDPSTVYAKTDHAKELLGWTAQYTDIKDIVAHSWQSYQP